MGSYYDTVIPLEVDKERVKIFTLKSSKKKVWYVKILRREGKGYFQKSLKTDSVQIAKDKATALYMDVWNTESKGLEYTDSNFSSTFIEFLDNAGMSKHRHTRAKGVYKRYFGPFFGQTPVNQIDAKMFNDYLRWRVEYWEREEAKGSIKSENEQGVPVYHYAKIPAEGTLKSERQILKQFMYYCAENRYVDRVPHLKVNLGMVRGVKFRSERQKSKALSPQMERKIELYLRKFCLTNGQKDKNWIRCFGRARLYYFIYLCRHTLMRPSTEATGLRWSDCRIEKSRKHDDLELGLIHVRESKTGKPRYCVLPYGQVHLLTKWRKMSVDFGFGKPDDYVFPTWEGKRCEAHIMGRLLRDKLIKEGLHRDEEGKVITLYSIARHTGITRRIEFSDWDVGQVASAAGTSVVQISQFYYEAFVNQNPDRWALTFKKGKPKLEDKRKQKLKDEISQWENILDGFNED